jgi:diguanylate cyclase (GGDEF)-like protein
MHWSVLLKDPQTGELSFTLVIGKCASKLQGMKIPAGQGVAGWVVEKGQPLIVEDVSQEPRFCSRVDRYSGFTTDSIIAVPLKTDNEIFGVIELVNKLEGGPFTPLDLKILTTIADYAALAIEKAYFFSALNKIADTDSLTGIYNRRAFDRMLEREIRICQRYKQPFSLLMIDIDDFKKINDQYGHPAGDAVLKKLGEILEQNVRKTDMVFRYGGDEFVVLMPRTQRKQASEARRRILRRIEDRNEQGPEIAFRASVGLHAMDSSGQGDILELLDNDLYREKSKKFPKNIDNIAENLQDMLQDERKRNASRSDDDLPF